jgi:hypothetical protein
MPTQTKADRQAAAQKAAATRKRNENKAGASERGRKAAATRRRNEAVDHLTEARRSASHAASDLGTAAKSLGDAAFKGWLSLLPFANGARANEKTTTASSAKH